MPRAWQACLGAFDALHQLIALLRRMVTQVALKCSKDADKDVKRK
jgi:hypothetical protein